MKFFMIVNKVLDNPEFVADGGIEMIDAANDVPMLFAKKEEAEKHLVRMRHFNDDAEFWDFAEVVKVKIKI